MTGSLLRPLPIVVALLCGLGGCGGRSYYSEIPEPEAPPRAAPEAPTRSTPSRSGYTVRRGDTLYSIAFSVGKDWREVAALNGIQAPYTIYPGQVLQLGVAVTPSPVEPPVSAGAASAVRTQAAPDSGAIVGPASVSPEPAPSAQPAPNAPARTAAQTPAVAPQSQELASHSPPATRAVMPAEPRQPAPRPGAWQWPAAGKLLKGFSAGSQPHKGVDLDGRSGDPVYAANSGSVVYAGNGVRGYGNLLIVKHDETFLSAYAHNSKLLVKEGDVVRGGEKIAEIGDSGTDRVKLHFEVRKQGNPVDPLKILPRR
jgi:lipoprotein NlpD